MWLPLLKSKVININEEKRHAHKIHYDSKMCCVGKISQCLDALSQVSCGYKLSLCLSCSTHLQTYSNTSTCQGMAVQIKSHSRAVTKQQQSTEFPHLPRQCWEGGDGELWVYVPFPSMDVEVRAGPIRRNLPFLNSNNCLRGGPKSRQILISCLNGYLFIFYSMCLCQHKRKKV